MYIVVFVIALAILVITSYLDSSITAKGIKAGLAYEGNWFINHIFSNKPTGFQVAIYDFVSGIVLSSLAIYGVIAKEISIVVMGVGPMAGYSIKHVQGYLAWKKLFKK